MARHSRIKIYVTFGDRRTMTLAQRRYESYVRAYNKKAAELAEYGARMSESMMDFGEYTRYYQVAARDYAKSKNIPKLVVEKQAREYSPAQARARARAMKEAGITVEKGYGKFKYQEGVNKDFDIALSKRYAELKAEGKMSNNEIRELLGIEFFYSDEEE